jgi:predicted P-loop ATPase
VGLAGAEDSVFNRVVGRLFLIAACRRVRQPGCKFDQIFVFESGQGQNKSSAVALLAVEKAWFTDNLPLDAAPKEVIEQISGVWVAEFAELKGLKGRRADHVKSFLSRQVDRARPAYGRRTATVPRQNREPRLPSIPSRLGDEE